MAMLSSKSSYNPTLGPSQISNSRSFSETSQRTQMVSSALQDGLFASPTESEFSHTYDGLESVRAWDENKVSEWLRSIRCGQYETLFRANNFTGESLLECDQKILAEMGIKKIGDRVRINVAIKQLRNKVTSTTRTKRNRDSLAALESYITGPLESPRQRSNTAYKRDAAQHLRSSSRPTSPMPDGALARQQRYMASPMEINKSNNSYFSQPNSAKSTNGRRPETPQYPPSSAKASNHLRQNSSLEPLNAGGLPANSPVIKVIHARGETKVINVRSCKCADDVTATVLRKLSLPERNFRNYCFYVLDGLEPVSEHCRRLSDEELMDICEDSNRSERNRLILRKINDGSPDIDELNRAAKLATEESRIMHQTALSSNTVRNQIKLQQLTGESWSDIHQAPLSPAPTTDRHRNIIATADAPDLEAAQRRPSKKDQASKLRSFFGARPPSEMIVQELTSYFPDHKSEEIEKTMRMSVRRSQRMSRAASRLSVVSNFSTASSLRDAPPLPPMPAIPGIADSWFAQPGAHNRMPGLRPLSVARLGNSSYRDSIASSSLHPLQEESPIEPNRKSYVSFAGSELDSATPGDDRKSYFDDSFSPIGHDVVTDRLSVIVAEDGEEEDEALSSFLAGNSFANGTWMKGDLIGEGSFGSVYLALHAVTGELMAVKQVELPDLAMSAEGDKKRTMMTSALKQEIDLLQGLSHPHIVQYLGTSSDETYLNIFLEYVPGGSIAGMLKQYNTFPEPLIRNFTRQILEGLMYLHKHNIIHRDIKGANILVDNRGAVKISDFGVSKKAGFNNTAPGTRTSLQGSVFWMAPEVVRQSGHSVKSDIWSVGCLIVEMFTGARPFPSMTTLQTLFAVGSNGEKPSIPENASVEARKFLELTFEVDPNKRPGADELLRENFMQIQGST